MNKLETESVTPIQEAPDELEPIGVEVVNDNLQLEGVDYDNEIVIAEPEVTHTDDGNLFVPVKLPANPVITPHLSQTMKNLEKHIPGVGRSYLQWQACMSNRMDYNKLS